MITLKAIITSNMDHEASPSLTQYGIKQCACSINCHYSAETKTKLASMSNTSKFQIAALANNKMLLTIIDIGDA
jgi:hypothetical protein